MYKVLGLFMFCMKLNEPYQNNFVLRNIYDLRAFSQDFYKWFSDLLLAF